MAEKYRYSKYLKPIYPTGRRSKRTIIPQTPYRPVTVRRTSSKEEEYNPEYSWMTVHRLGPHRDTVGINALEQRAVPSSERKGTLPERIMYKALRDSLHLVPGIDFDFQSYVEGGRTDKGGMVLDFVLPTFRLIIQVQGPTHNNFLQIIKDTEQRMIVAEWGYTVEYFTQEEIYNQVVFEEKLRRIFNLTNRRGCRGYNADAMISGDEYDRELYSRMFAMAQNIQAELLRV